jgi:ABC-type sugar transport system permease subunit
MNKYFRSRLAIFIFAFPALALFTTFVIYPLIPQIIISFQKHDGYAMQAWVGLSNYIETFKSSSFWLAQKNTLIILALQTFIGLPISLLLALVLDRQSEGIKRFFKAAILFPAILSVTVIGQMWIAIYEPQWGALNSILNSIGLENLTRSWLSEKGIVIYSIAFAFIYQYIGLNALFFYSGIRSIPRSYFEAAYIDGAGFFQTSFKITIPLLQEVIKYVLVLSSLGTLGLYALVRVMTAGGPGKLSRTIVYEMFNTAFSKSQFGLGSSIAVIFVIQCIFVSLIISRYVARKKIEY